MHAQVRGGADRKGQQCTSLAAYSTREIDMMPTMEQAFLPENPRGEYNQQGLYYSYSRQHPYLNEGEVQSVPSLLISIKYQLFLSFHVLQERVSRWIKPPTTSLVLGTLADLGRGKSELIAENALLRQQLIILRRHVKRPAYRKSDRLLLVLLARMVRAWKEALFLVQPETLLRWHRELFCMFWKHKSKAPPSKQRLSSETITLIKEMSANNRLWGAERIRGELLKLDIRVSKRTIQK